MRNFSVLDVKKSIYYALVESHLRYGLEVWGGAATMFTRYHKGKRSERKLDDKLQELGFLWARMFYNPRLITQIEYKVRCYKTKPNIIAARLHEYSKANICPPPNCLIMCSVHYENQGRPNFKTN